MLSKMSPVRQLAVNSDQHRLGLHRYDSADFHADAAIAKCQVRLRVYQRRVSDQVEIAVFRGQLDRFLTADQSLTLPAMLDEVFDCAHLELMPLAVLHEIGQASHLAIVIEYLANDCGLLQARQSGKIDAPFRVARTHENAAFLRPQSIDMALAADDVLRHRAVIDGDFDGVSAIKRRSAGGDSVTGVDLRREGRRLGIGMVGRLQVEVQAFANARRHCQADDAAAVPHHEVDGFGRHLLRGDDQVALVLAILVIDEHDHAAGPQLGQRLVDRAEAIVVSRHVRSFVASCELLTTIVSSLTLLASGARIVR